MSDKYPTRNRFTGGGTMTREFDAAAQTKARGLLENTPGDVHDKAQVARTIAYAALDELSRRDVTERMLWIENWQLKGALGYEIPANILPGNFRCGMCDARARRDKEAAERQAPDDTVFEEWWKENEHEPYTDRTWALLGWQERGRRVEVAERELRAELSDGDYWMERSKAFYENGGCPVCFATDEAGHTTNCQWGRDEAEIEKLRAAEARGGLV